jgi:phenylalanyl-tRNA synthetase alpha chain
MPENSHEKTLAALGVTQPDQVAPLFARLLSQASAELNALASPEAFEKFRVNWFGRKAGVVTLVGDNWLKPAARELKPAVGQELNKFKAQLEAQMEARRAAIESGAKETVSVKDRVDLSLPGATRPVGSRHLVRQVFQEIEDIFVSIGFSVVEGPEIETPYYNFEALNIPEFHPVRDDMDTFYVEAAGESGPKTTPGSLLLRTHTSPVQIRTMQKMKPPVRVVCPGKVHRNDAPDATHSPVFHQVEGLAVDTNITFCDLKGTLDHAMKALFGSSVKTRFYPSFFPFTEPSADVQISCIFCGGKGQRDGGPCRNCKASGWIELLGCGMVDPNVFGFVDYDPKKVGGFAFGMGVERIAILKYGVDDIQLFFNGDVRFLEQFA